MASDDVRSMNDSHKSGAYGSYHGSCNCSEVKAKAEAKGRREAFRLVADYLDKRKMTDSVCRCDCEYTCPYCEFECWLEGEIFKAEGGGDGEP